MKSYLEETKDVFKEVNSNENGLSSAEAEKRLGENGKNKLNEAKKATIFQMILEQISDPMIIMLIITAIISAVVSISQNESISDVFIILFVVVVNTILGILQESKAEKAIDSLKEMTAATSKVLRDGKEVVIKSEDLVVGDVVLFEAGDMVSADCRVVESHSLKVEEAVLTGESVPITKMTNILNLGKTQKDIPLGDRINMLYSGSTVAYGRGKGVVVSTGMNTEIGKIASALEQTQKEETPLQRKMTELSKMLTKLVILICILVFIVGFARAYITSGTVDIATLIDVFLIAISLAVAAIPEGMPAVVTIILSIGVTAMSKRKALIRKLSAVEALGCTQIICSDKTGTLTQNKMTVVDSYSCDKELLATAMALCSDSVIREGEDKALGEPTENALVEFANSIGLPKYELDKKYPRIGEVPFDSGRKLMSTIHKVDGKIIQYTKGACEMLLNICTKYLKDGKVVDITKEDIENIKKLNKEYADKALRVLGVAYKEYDVAPTEMEADKLENNLTFIGFVGMIDPCREEVYDAVEKCRTAGIRPIMITGDHKDTAVAIAKDLKIIEDASQAKTGEEINDLSDEELVEVVKNCSVFARVQPEHKTRIVKALQSQKLITAMTGDGVNDAPSIKTADVGISMGITGTDVTKGASDMVLADDNFATIVNAVEEGRKIYDNVKKVIQFQLSSNMAEVVAVFISSLFGFTILTPAHLLWINMVTDCIPGLALGMEKPEKDIMKRKPRPSNETLFSNGVGKEIAIHAFIMGFLVILAFFIGQYIEHGYIDLSNSPDGMSMAFITLNFIEISYALCMRSRTESIFKNKQRNGWLFGAFIMVVGVTIAVTEVPFFVKLFGMTPISWFELLVAALLAFAIIPILEFVKFIKRRKIRKQEAKA